MEIHQIIKTVRVTEKAQDMTAEDQYTFVVHPDANKKAIKRAVKELFDREVKSVNVMNVRGKAGRRTRYGTGRKADWKKAIVTLKDGQDPLELF
jgi:large subunit ribosomal protein L23